MMWVGCVKCCRDVNTMVKRISRVPLEGVEEGVDMKVPIKRTAKKTMKRKRVIPKLPVLTCFKFEEPTTMMRAKRLLVDGVRLSYAVMMATIGVVSARHVLNEMGLRG